MWRPQIRFSICSMQVAMLVVAVLLGIRLFIDPHLYWRDLWLLPAIALVVALAWGTIFGPWPARFFALGFFLGYGFEFLALGYCLSHDLVRFAPGTGTPEGWYPLTVPVLRILISRGWGGTPAAIAGFVLSGAICGGLLLVVGERLRRGTKRE